MVISSDSYLDDRAQEVVLHEIGHNWDDEGENDSIDRFRAISGWHDDPGLARYDHYVLSGDGSWVHFWNADFTRVYAATEPGEDFADCFALYWLNELGLTPKLHDTQFSELSQKMAYIQDFIEEMT
jgi:hypothetical protein